MPLLWLFGLCVLCWLVPYVAGTLAALAAMVAVGVGVVEFVTAALAGFAPAGPIKHLAIAPPQDLPDGRDPAYRSYYAGPVMRDYHKILRQAFQQIWTRILGYQDERSGSASGRPLVGRAWGWTKQSDSPYWQLLAVPAAVGAIGGLLLGMAAAFGLVAVISAVFGLLVAVMVLAALVTAATTRLAEFGALYLRGITIECGSCHRRVTRPIYRCPNCNAAHRCLVPGLAGVLHRTCRCRTTLPTLLAGGKAKLAAQCGECQAPLPVKGFSAPTAHIPVIAGPAAGKSVFMQTAVARLMVLGDAAGGGFEFADPRAKADFARNVQQGVHVDPNKMVKTVVRRPRAYNIYVGRQSSRQRRLLYLYDPAGEIPESVDHLANAQFLTFTNGIVFVVDPFSLRAVRSATDRAVLHQVKASNTAAKAVLERFVESLRERLPRTRSNRLGIPVAMVITKADALLTVSGIGHPYAGHGPAAVEPSLRAERDGALRAWLDKCGQRDLVLALDNQFATVGFFAVSYRDALDVSPHRIPGALADVTNDDPAAPLLWLLDRQPQRLSRLLTRKARR